MPIVWTMYDLFPTREEKMIEVEYFQKNILSLNGNRSEIW